MGNRDASIPFLNAERLKAEKKHITFVLSVTRDIMKDFREAAIQFSFTKVWECRFIASCLKFLQKRFKFQIMILYQWLHSRGPFLYKMLCNVSLSVQYNSIDNAGTHNLRVIVHAITIVYSLRWKHRAWRPFRRPENSRGIAHVLPPVFYVVAGQDISEFPLRLVPRGKEA